MRLKELADLQFQYSILKRTKMTKKALCDLIIPFRDKYSLTDGQALRIARSELPLSQIEKLMRNQEYTNADYIRAMSDEELAAWARKQIGCGSEFFPCGVVCDGKCNSFDDETCQMKIIKWLKKPSDEK